MNKKVIKFLMLIAALSCYKCEVQQNEPTTIKTESTSAVWNYLGEGSEKWKEDFSNCNGHFQSPVDIRLKRMTYNPLLKPFKFINYDEKLHWNFTNNGHTVILTLINSEGSSNATISLKGGNLEEKFNLLQIHFHWGRSNKQGSEHFINGHSFPLEMHMVHKSDASNQFLVLGYLFEISDEDNSDLDKLIDGISNAKDSNHFKAEDFELNHILPDEKLRTSYMQYIGSLTTPPCTEGIIWNIFKEKIAISSSQVRKTKNEFKI
jgi:carbonic anhydrase